jgi:hypothetical protein
MTRYLQCAIRYDFAAASPLVMLGDWSNNDERKEHTSAEVWLATVKSMTPEPSMGLTPSMELNVRRHLAMPGMSSWRFSKHVREIWQLLQNSLQLIFPSMESVRHPCIFCSGVHFWWAYESWSSALQLQQLLSQGPLLVRRLQGATSGWRV